MDRLTDWLAANRDGLLLGTAVAIGLVAVMLLLRSLGRQRLRRDPLGQSWPTVLGRVLAKTSLAFMIAAAAEIVATYAELPPRVARVVDVGFVIAFALQGAVWARELILALIARKAADDNGESTLGNATAIIRVLVSVLLFGVALILILDNLGVNVTALIAGLGIGGIAIGLAAQGIFSDLFAALAILFDRPFKRGDTIRYDQSIGTVEKIGLKTTRLRSLTGEQLIMANTKLLEREIHNLAEAKARRMTLHIALKSNSPSATLHQLEQAAKAAVAAIKGCKLVRCVVLGVASEAVLHEIVYDDPSLDNNAIAGNRSAILVSVLEALSGSEIEVVRAADLPAPHAPL